MQQRKLTALVSLTEVTPNVMMESLAAGTPSVCTTEHSLDGFSGTPCFREVPPTDIPTIRNTIVEVLENTPSADDCRNLVQHLTWDNVADMIISAYDSVL